MEIWGPLVPAGDPLAIKTRKVIIWLNLKIQ